MNTNKNLWKKKKTSVVPQGELNDSNDEIEDDTGSEITNTVEVENEVSSEFPDTDVKIGFDRLGSVEIKTKSASFSEESTQVSQEKKNYTTKNEKKGGKNTLNIKEVKHEESKKSDNIRGKKGKLKKIKEKYKDQDEEERELRMQLLQSEGKGKEGKGKKNKKGLEQLYGKSKSKAVKEKRPPPKPKTEIVDGEEVVVEEEKVAVNDETDMLDSLTGIPVSEDELLFAIPVCAPYNTLINYKFKVKLTPGTGKRGKSCKTALAMFLADKNSNQREKDLLKSVKDQDLARNLPGKVKLSAPHLQKVKSKK